MTNRMPIGNSNSRILASPPWVMASLRASLKSPFDFMGTGGPDVANHRLYKDLLAGLPNATLEINRVVDFHAAAGSLEGPSDAASARSS